MTKDEALKKAFKQAFQLGQDYWYQADHEFESQNKKSDVTRAKFEQLMEDAIKEALAQQALDRKAENARELGLDYEPEQEPVIDGNTSDGYHTFNELYEFRKAYNIALFNEWAANGKCFVHKSWRHNDGELCFGGGWFIVVAVLPQGQISNHYEAKDWDLFHIQETEKALFEFDGHTGADVIERLKSYTNPPQRKPLSDEEINDIAKNYALNNPTTPLHFARAIEAAHGIKGEA